MRQEMAEFWHGSGINWTKCKQSAPRSRQITTPTPHNSIFTGRMLFLTPNQQCQITEGNWPIETYKQTDHGTAETIGGILCYWHGPQTITHNHTSSFLGICCNESTTVDISHWTRISSRSLRSLWLTVIVLIILLYISTGCVLLWHCIHTQCTIKSQYVSTQSLLYSRITRPYHTYVCTYVYSLYRKRKCAENYNKWHNGFIF